MTLQEVIDRLQDMKALQIKINTVAAQTGNRPAQVNSQQNITAIAEAIRMLKGRART